MKPHSRRFAQHTTFLYLLYNVIRLRDSSLGHSLLTKRADGDRVHQALSNLTAEKLQTLAAHTASSEYASVPSDPDINLLRRAVDAISTHIPQLYGGLKRMTMHIQALFVRDGLPAFWMTLNPSDLKSPLVLQLAGVPIVANFPRRDTAQTMYPVSATQFFYETCNAVFRGLMQVESDKPGILGKVSNYFGVIETNGRGMQHLHALIWLQGNLDFHNLRERVENDPSFAQRLISFIESIIQESLDHNILRSSSILANISSSSRSLHDVTNDSDDDYCQFVFSVHG